MMRPAIFVLLMLFTLPVVAVAQERALNRDPKLVKFVHSDIDNFWRAYDLAATTNDRAGKARIFQTEYFDKGSDGLKDFTQLRIKSAEALVDRIAKMPRFYASARRPTLEIARMEKRLRRNFARFKEIYPDATFPDVYFVVGIASSGGTTGPSGLLIGAEMYSLTETTPMEELAPWLKTVLAPVKNIPAIVAHESCHFNQRLQPDGRLLARAISEGSCDMIGELVSGGNINTHLQKWADPRQPELWTEFTSQMNGTATADWLYNGSTAKDRPGDLGYYIGYRISRAYYLKARDKRQAVRDVLNVRDYEAFLKASGYSGKG